MGGTERKMPGDVRTHRWHSNASRANIYYVCSIYMHRWDPQLWQSEAAEQKTLTPDRQTSQRSRAIRVLCYEGRHPYFPTTSMESYSVHVEW